MKTLAGLFMVLTSISAQGATIECPQSVQTNYFKCPRGTDCQLLKNDITTAPFHWNGEAYLAEIQVTVDSTSCTGFPKEGSDTDLYLAANGVRLEPGKKPATVIKLGVKETINLAGSGPIRIFDNDPEWTLGYLAGTFCDIKISCTDAISVSTGKKWLSAVNGLVDIVNIQRTFLENEGLLTFYYKTYVDDKSTSSWLREEADRMVEFDDETEVMIGQQILKMLDGASKDLIFKPFNDARAQLNANLIPLEKWENQLTWALNKADVSQKQALERALARAKDARNPPRKS